MNNELMYPSRETIYRLTNLLKLKGTSAYTQDWECEVADVEQLTDYLKCYNQENLNVNEKMILMRIILEAYNDFVDLYPNIFTYQSEIKEILEQDYFIHKETIEYWSCGEEDLDNCFSITAFIRNIFIQKLSRES